MRTYNKPTTFPFYEVQLWEVDAEESLTLLYVTDRDEAHSIAWKASTYQRLDTFVLLHRGNDVAEVIGRYLQP